VRTPRSEIRHKTTEIINVKTFEMFVNVNSDGHLYACGVPIWRTEKEKL
jgi:hypothetical protein